VTLDDDVGEKLRRVARASGRPFREVVNEALQVGLQVLDAWRGSRPLVVEARDMGLREGLSLDNIGDLLEDTESCAHR